MALQANVLSKPTGKATMTSIVIQNWMIDFFAREMKMNRNDIAVDVEFSEYDFDSALAYSMVSELEDLLDRKLSPTLAYNYPTIEALANCLAGSR